MRDKGPLEIARRLVELGEAEKAARAYALALKEGLADTDPAAALEAAVCVLQFGKEYRLAYTTFHSLHRRGLYRQETFGLMTGAFYEPNERELRGRYERNCKLLRRYPYLFRRDFLSFEDLPIRFYPYDEGQYIPYFVREDRFGDLTDFKEPVIRHYFFKDLDDPILAEDIYSQYELEYLNDNVRKSEYVARENHIYLHYTDWAVFCAHLQCWNLRPLLEDEKFVFLIEDEISQYPIDFKARFGIDYGKYTLEPIGIREVKRLIWHTQLSSHNGGDFFNEIFDAHPNLIVMPSLMLEGVEKVVEEIRGVLDQITSDRMAESCEGDWSPRTIRELYLMKDRSDRDILVGCFLNDARATAGLDRASRIAPALFFQPHFGNIEYTAELDEKGRAVLRSDQYEQIRRSPIFRYFKYIKTFTPLRRVTTSHGATVKFMLDQVEKRKEGEKYRVVDDVVTIRILNRSFMTDPQDRLHKDSVLVRFEDGKLNPKATFTALAEFLDLPYTETLTYCSEFGTREFVTEGNVSGFDPATVYRTYDGYISDAERILIEYFMRDVYDYYGYDFQYYDGRRMDREEIERLVHCCDTLDGFIRETYRPCLEGNEDLKLIPGKTREETIELDLDEIAESVYKNRMDVLGTLMQGLHFVNLKGQPLRMAPKLELDPALLEQPLYH